MCRESRCTARSQPPPWTAIERAAACPGLLAPNPPDPLLMAASGGTAVVRALLSVEAAVDSAGEGRWTALFMAANNGHEPAVRALLSTGLL